MSPTTRILFPTYHALEPRSGPNRMISGWSRAHLCLGSVSSAPGSGEAGAEETESGKAWPSALGRFGCRNVRRDSARTRPPSDLDQHVFTWSFISFHFFYQVVIISLFLEGIPPTCPGQTPPIRRRAVARAASAPAARSSATGRIRACTAARRATSAHILRPWCDGRVPRRQTRTWRPGWRSTRASCAATASTLPSTRIYGCRPRGRPTLRLSTARQILFLLVRNRLRCQCLKSPRILGEILPRPPAALPARLTRTQETGLVGSTARGRSSCSYGSDHGIHADHSSCNSPPRNSSGKRMTPSSSRRHHYTIS